MKLKMKLLKDLLLSLIEKIDNGTCNPSESEIDEVIKLANAFDKSIKRISKAMACDNILHCSQSTFNHYLDIGVIPPGKKEKGFKELSWSEEDLLKAKEYIHACK